MRASFRWSPTLVETAKASVRRSQSVPSLALFSVTVDWFRPVFTFSPGKLRRSGANFPGAWNQYRRGHNYAHRSLQKVWHDDVYALIGNEWRVAGHLPEARAYGLSIQLSDGVLLVGGENQQGKVVGTVELLRWNGDTARIAVP